MGREFGIYALFVFHIMGFTERDGAGKMWVESLTSSASSWQGLCYIIWMVNLDGQFQKKTKHHSTTIKKNHHETSIFAGHGVSKPAWKHHETLLMGTPPGHLHLQGHVQQLSTDVGHQHRAVPGCCGENCPSHGGSRSFRIFYWMLKGWT